MKIFLFFSVLIITVLFSLVVVNTVLFTSKQLTDNPTPNLASNSTLEINVSPAQKSMTSQLLSGAIKFKTIAIKLSDKEKLVSRSKSEFIAFNHYLAKKFPKSHEILTKELISQHSLLYIWQGSQPQLKPVLFITHSDVVPVDSQTINRWLYPPFSGEIADGFIWGRGSMDNKSNVIAQFIAIEQLIISGFQPKQTLLFSIGADEETGGNNGAKNIADYLLQNNLIPATILDEGGIISKNIIPAISKPVALIGIAEKGYLTLYINVTQPGGHASMPPEKTATSLLAKALFKLENNPFPATMTQPIKQMFDFLGPEMGLINKSIFANLWLTEFLVNKKLTQSASTNASVKTTLAITQINAGIAENVLPTSASATVNIRLLPGDRIETVREKIADIINNPDITIDIAASNVLPAKQVTLNHEASSISETDTHFFRTLQVTINQLFPNTLVAPYLTITATDSRHFKFDNTNIYRFSPLPVNKEDLKRIHGINERISIEDFNNEVNYYQLLIKNLNQD